MKFFRKNGEPAVKTNSGRCSSAKTEGPPEQLNEQGGRDQPHNAPEREDQPQRNPVGEQRHDRADQRALGEAEMIVDQQMDVGNVRRQRELVEENPDQTAALTASIKRQGFSHTRKFIRHRNVSRGRNAQRVTPQRA